jgi:hypothetical protein
MKDIILHSIKIDKELFDLIALYEEQKNKFLKEKQESKGNIPFVQKEKFKNQMQNMKKIDKYLTGFGNGYSSETITTYISFNKKIKDKVKINESIIYFINDQNEFISIVIDFFSGYDDVNNNDLKDKIDNLTNQFLLKNESVVLKPILSKFQSNKILIEIDLPRVYINDDYSPTGKVKLLKVLKDNYSNNVYDVRKLVFKPIIISKIIDDTGYPNLNLSFVDDTMIFQR